VRPCRYACFKCCLFLFLLLFCPRTAVAGLDGSGLDTLGGGGGAGRGREAAGEGAGAGAGGSHKRGREEGPRESAGARAGGAAGGGRQRPSEAVGPNAGAAQVDLLRHALTVGFANK
jgi:hypothetical protein